MTAQSLTEVAVPGGGGRQVLDARYFDTATYCLQKAKLAYRIRREGEQWVATIKGGGLSSGGLHERQEWNIVVNDAQPDITVFEGTDIGKYLIELVGNQRLKPILITKFERRTLDVIMPDGSQIEVAADQGTIVAGSKKAPILEIELELKSGKPSALFQLGAALAREYPLLPESDSKFYRGLKLAGLATVQPQKAAKIDKNQLVGVELRTILVQLIAQFFMVQQAFLENSTQPEHMHELRISLRRLRSLLEFYRPLIVHEQYKYHQAELRKLGQMLGTLREIDVAYVAWQQCSDCQFIPIESKKNLGDTLAKHRLLEAVKIYEILKAGFATPLLLDLWAMLIDNKGWQLVEHQRTLGEYSMSRLSSWLKIVTKQGKLIDWSATENVHKLRLMIKKIRYAAEVLEPVFYEVPQLILRLDILQNNLGLLSDANSTVSLLEKLLKAKSSKILYLEVGMVIGWQGREVLSVQDKMDKHWKKFYRTAQKWL
ncbi:MAG: domain containing protein [Firmicutes bacterium]|nr:domain containing protein [Bacillota bacterium]